MKKNLCNIILLTAMINSSCVNSTQQPVETKDSVLLKSGSFGYDLNSLSQHDSVVVLLNDIDNSRLIVSPKYQFLYVAAKQA